MGWANEGGTGMGRDRLDPRAERGYGIFWIPHHGSSGCCLVPNRIVVDANARIDQRYVIIIPDRTAVESNALIAIPVRPGDPRRSNPADRVTPCRPVDVDGSSRRQARRRGPSPRDRRGRPFPFSAESRSTGSRYAARADAAKCPALVASATVYVG